MTVHEPLTFASDLAIALVAGSLGWRLVWHDAAPGDAGRPARAWGWALLASAAGALSGGIWHAIAPEIPRAIALPLWKLTLIAIGLASAAMLVATARALLAARGQRLLVAAAGAQLVLYLAWVSTHDDFLYVILDYGSAMLVVLGFHLGAAIRRVPGARRIVEAVALSFVAAAIQQSPLALGPLDHNVLYHLVQLGAFVLFYLGGRALGGGADAPTAGSADATHSEGPV